MRHYTAFIDESGQRELGPETDRYFVMAGLVTVTERATAIHREIVGLKRAAFRCRKPNMEIKSNWLRIPSEREKRYLLPYKVGDERLTLLTNSIYDWLLGSGLVLLAGVVDKELLKEKYKYPHNPSALAYGVFLQRYEKYLAKVRGRGEVVVDDISGKTRAGNEWKSLLLRQHRKLKDHGCPYTRAVFSNTGDSVSFADSESSNLLQLADLCAYNVFRQFRDHGESWDDPEAKKLKLYSHFARLIPLLDKNSVGVFAGYGVQKLPMRARNLWLAPK